jgi:hypothetical protein
VGVSGEKEALGKKKKKERKTGLSPLSLALHLYEIEGGEWQSFYWKDCEAGTVLVGRFDIASDGMGIYSNTNAVRAT